MNKGCLIGGGVLLAIALVLGLWVMGIYNNIVPKDQDIKDAWARVETAYQRRADLIPQLVSTVKGAVGAENKILNDVINARASATQMKIDPSNLTPEKLAEFQAKQGELSSALSRLMVVVEQYPQLKSIEGFNGLQSQLEGTENRIKAERDNFNTTVKDYNSYILKFPTNIIASFFGKTEKAFFKSDSGAEKAPKVDFDYESTK